MAKQLLFDDRARLKLQRGLETLAEAVAITMGPTGRNVIIDKSFGNPVVTKDGVTVSKEIELEDPFEHMGAKLVNEVANKTSDTAGDGTTTATVLARSIYQEGLRNISLGANPTVVRRGIEKSVEAAIHFIESELAQPIPAGDLDKIAQVGAISANNDEEVGKMLAEAMRKTGPNGVITIEEGKTGHTELKFAEGMQFDKGYLSPYLVTHLDEMKVIYEDCLILFHEKKISNLRDLIPLLEKVVGSGKPLLIIAEDIESEVLTALVMNKLQGNLNVVGVKAPGFGDRRKAMLHDMAILTGGEMFSEDLGRKLESVQLEELGTCSRVEVTKDNTVLIDGQGEEDKIKARVQQLRDQIAATDSEYDREKYQERVAKLSGGVAIISVGASTETEMKQTKARIEDANYATKAAVETGIVPGGGVALLRAIKAVKEVKLKGDEKIGGQIIAKALEAPIRQIAENCGVDGAVVADEVLSQDNPHYGYDASTGEYGDLLERGIIDPVKVVRSALSYAASIAGLMLTTDVLVTRTDDGDGQERADVEGSVR